MFPIASKPGFPAASGKAPRSKRRLAPAPDATDERSQPHCAPPRPSAPPTASGHARVRAALRAVLAGGAVAILVAVLAGPAHGADEEKLERFLARLGLADLQIVHLERSLESEATAADERERLARRLADLYAEQLMNRAGEAEAYNDLVQRIQNLLARHPQANTTALQVMLLQADYNRAEAQIAQWIADRANAQALTDARAVLEKIAPQLDLHQTQLNSQVEALLAEIDRMADNDPELAAKENESRRLQAVLGRASYFAGWANYYLGLTKESGEAEYRRAVAIFRKLLAIEEDDYAKLDPEWLSLEVIWRARAVIGLGLAEAALGQVDASRACFALLEHAVTPPEIQDQAPYWFVQGLINAGRLKEAHEYAAKKIEVFTASATQGKVSLCVALVRAGFGAGAPDNGSPGNGSPGNSPTSADTLGRELAMLGMTGLAKLGQYNAVQQLLEKYNIPLDAAEGFFLQWMNGRRLFAQAQESKQPEDYKAAAKVLTAALQQPDAAVQAAAAGHCRYELGWCLYRAGDLEAAARQFEQAVTSLKAAGAQEAANAAWMAFVSYRQLAETEPRFTSAAIEVLQTIKRNFPGHEYAKNADYHIAKLQRDAGSPEESIRNLEKIAPGDPNYAASRYDLCVLLYQQWSAAKNASDKTALVGRLRQTAEVYLRAAGARGDPERRVQVLLMTTGAALGNTPANPALAAELLTRAEPLVAALPDVSSAKAEYHYRRWQLARLEQDAAARREHARWLAAHAAGTAYEAPALIEIARDLEQRLEAASDADRGKLHEEAFAVYTRLVERLGASPQAVQSQKNVRVALSRLAQYAYATGRYDEAARRLAPLLETDPKNKDYLRLAGLANFQVGDYPAALESWRTLTHGVGRGSEDWFEAKYYQIACLAEIDGEQARKTLDNLHLLYPQYGGPSWREKFEALAQRLK